MISCSQDAGFLKTSRKETPYFAVETAVEKRNYRNTNALLQLFKECRSAMKGKLLLLWLKIVMKSPMFKKKNQNKRFLWWPTFCLCFVFKHCFHIFIYKEHFDMRVI